MTEIERGLLEYLSALELLIENGWSGRDLLEVLARWRGRLPEAHAAYWVDFRANELERVQRVMERTI